MENSFIIPPTEITLKPPKSHGLISGDDYIDPEVGKAWSARYHEPQAGLLLLEHILNQIKPPGFQELFKP